jgi:hypothetical protein
MARVGGSLGSVLDNMNVYMIMNLKIEPPIQIFYIPITDNGTAAV